MSEVANRWTNREFDGLDLGDGRLNKRAEILMGRSQDVEVGRHDAGQFCRGKAQAWLAGRPLFGKNAAPVPLAHRRVQDIDTPEDWERADLMFATLLRSWA